MCSRTNSATVGAMAYTTGNDHIYTHIMSPRSQNYIHQTLVQTLAHIIYSMIYSNLKPYCTVLYYTLLYPTIPYCTILYYTILYYTILYYTRLD